MIGLWRRSIAWLLPGTYAHHETLLLTPEDSFTTFAALGPKLADPDRVEVVVPHYWLQERMPTGRSTGSSAP